MQKLIFKLRLKNLNILFSICLIGWPEISSYIMKCWLTWFKIGFSSHSEVFTHMETCHHYRWGASNFDLYVVHKHVLITTEQWGFFDVPNLLWYGTSVYMEISEVSWHSYLLPSVFAMELSLPVLMTWVFRNRESNPDLTHAWFLWKIFKSCQWIFTILLIFLCWYNLL